MGVRYVADRLRTLMADGNRSGKRETRNTVRNSLGARSSLVRCNNLAVARCLQLERYTALRQFYNNYYDDGYSYRGGRQTCSLLYHDHAQYSRSVQ